LTWHDGLKFFEMFPSLFCISRLAFSRSPQFDSEDYRMIEDGKKKVSWWGTVEPILIGQSAAPAPPPMMAPARTPPPAPTPQGTSAEVSVSRGAAPSSSGPKKTSLQF